MCTYVSKIPRFAQDSLGESWKARNSRSEKLKHSTTEKLWFSGKRGAQDLSSGFSFSGLQRYILFGGFNPSEKYEFVSWDDEIPKGMESHNPNVPNHQPVEVGVTIPNIWKVIIQMFQTTKQYTYIYIIYIYKQTYIYIYICWGRHGKLVHGMMHWYCDYWSMSVYMYLFIHSFLHMVPPKQMPQNIDLEIVSKTSLITRKYQWKMRTHRLWGLALYIYMYVFKYIYICMHL